jgi:hypothetical protein
MDADGIGIGGPESTNPRGYTRRKNTAAARGQHAEFVNHPTTLRAVEAGTYYGRWPAETAIRHRQKTPANAHNGESGARLSPSACAKHASYL